MNKEEKLGMEAVEKILIAHKEGKKQGYEEATLQIHKSEIEFLEKILSPENSDWLAIKKRLQKLKGGKV